jgi:3' exoribonuclease, RNase T-like
MKHLMVDLETLGTTADSVILSIGAVKFDLEGDSIVDEEGFYSSISIDSNLELGRKVNEDTMLWWLKQPAAAQQVFHEEKFALLDALEQFSDWVENRTYTVWSNGASFDIPMLEHAYKTSRMEVPWEFWNTRCFRTYKNLPGARGVKMPEKQGIRHNALSDAYNQARELQALHAHFFPKFVNSMVKAKSK